MSEYLELHGAMTFAEMLAEVRANTTDKGWRTGTNTFGDYIALLHSEASEALEAFRDHGDLDPHYEPRGDSTEAFNKPVGVDSELADVLIRLLDMADVYNIDLWKAYQEKMAYNRTRPYQHGGRTLNESGRVDHDARRPPFALLKLLSDADTFGTGKMRLQHLAIQWPSLAAALGEVFAAYHWSPPASLRRAMAARNTVSGEQS